MPDDPPTEQLRDDLRASAQPGSHETALREILQVISQSRDDEAPVFDAILLRAGVLCNAAYAGLALANDARTHLVYTASHGHDLAHSQYGKMQWALDGASSFADAVRERRAIRIDNLADTDLYRSGDPQRVAHVDEDGIRSFMAVPLLHNGEAIGAFGLARWDVDPFSQSEQDLVAGFAAQAVIAIENVRQFRELQTRLEREEATREILHVISQNRDDEIPVFEAILDRAQNLCHAQAAGLQLVNPERTRLRLVVGVGPEDGVFKPGDEFDLDGPTALATAVREARVIHMEDLKDSQLYRDGHPLRVKLVDEEGVRTQLTVPLLKDGIAFGTMTLSRYEQRPFSEDEIALVETFASQAVIAIENVRQFRELQTRLEREEASREILQVISSSRDDTAPVFEVILRNAARLSGAPLANLCLLNAVRSHWHLVAHFGDGLRHLAVGTSSTPLDSELVPAIAMRTARVAQIEDLTDTDLYRQGDPGRVAMVDVEGMRTIVCVPLVRGAEAIGCITLFRRQVKGFTNDEIALVETFASQAVIAIENVRQFRELQTRLEREAATRDILEVISRSRDDDQPVFDIIIENAAQLCNTPFAFLMLRNTENTHLEFAAENFANSTTMEDLRAHPYALDNDQLLSIQALNAAKVWQIPDLSKDPAYANPSPQITLAVEQEKLRTLLYVPLLKNGQAIGLLGLFKHEVAPFRDDEIALVETFAAQAVIAIENVRQFKALEDRTAEVENLNTGLEQRVEVQVGELERMGRLKRFLSPQVADAIVSTGSDKLLTSHRSLLGILFCDIRGFTAFCETAEPEETIEVLQTYHEEMGKLIVAHGAGVDHRSGDGIMVLFNDPLPCDDPAGAALRLGLAMQARMQELCADWKRLGHRLGFGVGISLGYATVGMVGSEGRFDYTASGTAVNLASRLCDTAEDGEILLSPRARAAVEEDFEAESAGAVSLKGIREPVEAFRVITQRS